MYCSRNRRTQKWITDGLDDFAMAVNLGGRYVISQDDQEIALEHGEAYARLAPSIPHAAHMWGHDLRRVGRVDEAIVQFRKADTLERAYYAAEKIDPSMDWHHGHNLDLLGMCYQHKGQMALAESTLREASNLVPLDTYGAYRRRELPHFLIERGRFANLPDVLLHYRIHSTSICHTRHGQQARAVRVAVEEACRQAQLMVPNTIRWEA